MIRTLYVDDEEGLLDIAKAFLEMSGELQVDTCLTVNEAEKRLLQSRYDAVISDYQMPDMNGIDFLKKLRSRGNEIPFILFTGRGREEVVIDALNSGANFYLQKGGRPQAQFVELEHKVKEAVRRNRAEKALSENEQRLRRAHTLGKTGCWEYDWIQNPNVIWASEEGLKIFGVCSSDSNVPVKEIENCISEPGRVHQALVDLIEKGKRYNLEYRINPANGDPPRIINSVAEVEKDHKGNPIKVVGVIKDITERNKAEERLKASKIQLTMAMDLAQLAYWEYDPIKEVYQFNDRFFALYGTTAEREGGYLIPRESYYHDFIHPDDIDKVREFAKKAPDYFGNRLYFEHRIVRRDGNIRYISVHPSQIKDENGRILKVFGVNQDVTERKQIAWTLHQSEQNNLSVIENATEGIIIAQDWMTKYANPKALEMIQLGADEILNHCLDEYLHPDDMEQVRDRHRRRVQGEEVPALNEFRILSKNGSIVWVSSRSINFQWEGLPATLNFLTDITEHKKVEEEIRRNQEILRDAMNISSLVHWEYDTENDAFIFDDHFYLLYGTSGEREGAYCMSAERYGREFVHPDDMHVVLEEITKAIANKDPKFESQLEHRIVRRDGKVRHIIVRYKMKVDATGKIVGWKGANQDITERKVAEQELQQANRNLALLNSITRHDVMNQTMIIQGYADILEGKGSITEQQVVIGKISRSAQTIQRQMEFVKLYQEIGMRTPMWQSILETICKVKSALDIGNLTLNVKEPDYVIRADPMFEKVVYNLVENCIRYSNGATVMNITTSESADKLKIVFEDNGQGICSEDKVHLFERGFGKNTGFGLFLSREILSITSINIIECGQTGNGARFEITVPSGTFKASGVEAN
jgi:PAS domain S-box-containing protein